MSRSYKKTPGWTQSSGLRGGNFYKKYANRRFRKYTGPVQNGGWFKQYTNPYDICDYKFLYYSENEVDLAVEDYPRIPKYKYYMK